MNIKNILNTKKNTILALEIEQRWVKGVVSKEYRGIRTITGLSAERILNTNDNTIVKGIKDLLYKFKLSQFTLVISLPRHSATLRYIKLPSINPVEIAEMARLQAIKQVPYSKDELVIGHKILAKDTKGYSNVMLVAVHKNALNKHLNVLRMAGLEPEFIGLSSEAIDHYSFIAEPTIATSINYATAVIDIDSSSTEIQVHHAGSLVFSRNINQGLNNFETRNWLDEIKLSFSAYKRDKGSFDINNAILTGGGWEKKALGETLSNELALRVAAVNPLKNINIVSNVKSNFERASYPLSFSSVIALALNYDRLSINLLPGSFRVEQEKKSKYKTLISAGILTACIVLIFTAFLFKKLYDNRIYLKILREKLAAIAPEAEALDMKAKMTRTIIQHSTAKGSCLDVLREIHAITPSNIYLTKLIFDEGKGVTLKGSSSNMSLVFKFVSVLEGSELFSNVQLRYASKSKKKEIDITDFEIYSPLR